MSIYAGTIILTDSSRKLLIPSFAAIEGRPPEDCVEIEKCSLHHLNKAGRFPVLDGSRAKHS
jgi:hypothetical protein